MQEYTEQWLCGHCPFLVEIPDQQTNPDGFHDTIMLIREHRFGHITDAFMAETDEPLTALCEDTSSGFSFDHLATAYAKYGPPRPPVTVEDVAPALAEADRIVRGVA